MRYLTATLGGVFIFLGVFVLTAILVAFLPPIFRVQMNLGFVRTNNALGTALALIASIASFRATLRRARAEDAKRG